MAWRANGPAAEAGATELFDLRKIRNLDEVLDRQVQSFHETRQVVKDLQFVPIEPVATYSAVTYKAIDGGELGLSFDPFELNLIKVADSYGNDVLSFLAPTGEDLQDEDFQFLASFKEVQKFIDLLQVPNISTGFQFLRTPHNVMQFVEYACLFERLARNADEPLLLMKDGLLRTVLVRPRLRPRLYQILRECRKQKIVGVAKSSQVVNQLGTALWAEQKIPPNQAGYIEIPVEMEQEIYRYHHIYQFGRLFIAKLAARSDLLVTVEVPYDTDQHKDIYSPAEVDEIMGHLAKDAMFSFPTIGYPQTIMRAHEKAIATGFVASVWQDLIRDELLRRADAPYLQNLFREAWLLRQYVKKPNLGGV